MSLFSEGQLFALGQRASMWFYSYTILLLLTTNYPQPFSKKEGNNWSGLPSSSQHSIFISRAGRTFDFIFNSSDAQYLFGIEVSLWPYARHGMYFLKPSANLLITLIINSRKYSAFYEYFFQLC